MAKKEKTITPLEFKGSNEVATGLVNTIFKELGTTFPIYRLKDVFVLTNEKTEEILHILDSVGFIRKLKHSKIELLMSDKQRLEYIEERVVFYRGEAKVFLEAEQHFLELKAYIEDESRTSKGTIKSPTPKDDAPKSKGNPKQGEVKKKGSKDKVDKD